MQPKHEKQESIDTILETIKEISLLIEDNTQNVRDCNRALRQIQNQLQPKKRSIIKSIISKLLNMYRLL